ncbi:hypothetical protein H6P81_009427 [Aristolochia fimbriata]|uniref:Uncharacterized protein n=1 Tax=Aristolochia fimbriata TaxID=158543 RepID=A0AAV7ENZ6_ARIFI|nr:hypothetical protein H6P81_009427 [Aristolochia fimbriata]
MEELEIRMAKLEEAYAKGESISERRIDVPDRETHGRVRDTEAIEHFLWQMQEYLRTSKLKKEKVKNVDPSQVKAMNAEARTVHGRAMGTTLVMGEWVGSTDFTIADLDSLNVILGLDFLYLCKAFVIPYCGAIGFMRDEGFYMYSKEGTIVNKKARLLSGLQLEMSLEDGANYKASEEQSSNATRTSALWWWEYVTGRAACMDKAHSGPSTYTAKGQLGHAFTRVEHFPWGSLRTNPTPSPVANGQVNGLADQGATDQDNLVAHGLVNGRTAQSAMGHSCGLGRIRIGEFEFELGGI